MTDGRPVPDHALGRLLRDLREASLALSPRELEAVRWLSHGLTRKMTAEQMGISPYTVDEYLERAQIKLQTKNARHTCCAALRLGLID